MTNSYLAEVSSRAWRKTIQDVLGASVVDRVVRFSTLALTLVFAFSWLRIVDITSSVLADVLSAAALGIAATATLIISGFFINAFVLIPSTMWAEQKFAVEGLQKRIAPAFSISCSSRAPEDVSYGRSNVSYSGTIQTVVSASPKSICLDVSNESSISIKNCEAYIIKFSNEGASYVKKWQSIKLPWLRVGDSFDKIDIPPNGNRTISLFNVINNRVLFTTLEMPTSVVHAIGDTGTFIGEVVVTVSGEATTFIKFELCCDAPANPPVLRLVG